MTRRRKRRNTPEWQWEQALIDDYYDHRWHKVLDPLYDQFQRWKAGELTHNEMDQAIHKVHKENQETYKLFHQDRGFVITLIQLDREWFDAWVADNPPPPGIKLAYPLLFPSSDDETTA
jgi:hypothetical protein